MASFLTFARSLVLVLGATATASHVGAQERTDAPHNCANQLVEPSAHQALDHYLDGHIMSDALSELEDWLEQADLEVTAYLSHGTQDVAVVASAICINSDGTPNPDCRRTGPGGLQRPKYTWVIVVEIPPVARPQFTKREDLSYQTFLSEYVPANCLNTAADLDVQIQGRRLQPIVYIYEFRNGVNALNTRGRNSHLSEAFEAFDRQRWQHKGAPL